MFPNLFQPITIKGMHLRNRLVMAPIDSVFRTEEGASNDRHRAYLAERARGGVGLILTDALAVEWPRGAVGAKGARIDQDRFIPALNDVAEDVHAEGAAIVAQLIHAGRQATLRVTQGQPLISASDVAFEGSGAVPKVLTVEEIQDVIEMFVEGARRCITAGFDGVEIHAAHGYLLSSFLSPFTNRRTDIYGGTTENRCRIVTEILARVRELAGEDYPIFVRMNGCDFVDGGITPEEAVHIAAILERGGADVIDVSAGMYESDQWTYPPMMAENGVNIDLAARIKTAVHVPVIGVGKILDPRMADEFIAAGKADLIAMGRALLCDPELPNKARAGRPELIRPCIACNYGCIGTIERDRHMRCSINPALGREYEGVFRFDQPAARSRHAVVVGGGPAGMEFARLAAGRGHKVTLCEQRDLLGGQLLLAAKAPFKADISRYQRWLVQELDRAGVDVRLRTTVNMELLLQLQPDVVAVATGARPLQPAEVMRVAGDIPVEVFDRALEDPAAVPAGKVAVIGAGLVGCEVAMVLAGAGRSVIVVEQMKEFLPDQDFSVQAFYAGGFGERGVQLQLQTKALAVEGRHLVVHTPRAVERLEVDAVVLAAGMRPVNPLAAASDLPWPTYTIGDSARPRNLLYAVDDAYRLAARI